MTEAAIFPATRAAALERLAAFVPHAGADYARGRNSDPGPGHPSAVSELSPYVRYRMITEQEIVRSVLARHALSAADKYVQEVLWRTYWKGWLEMRPQVWQRFLDERDHQRDHFTDTGALAVAEGGATGIEGFDDWARELVATGYLHNHARMWFASIWIFTLRLPWALGADFFLRHLLDADAASNTLSWRWVAGLQTLGKTYLARADNIARYTNGRFEPQGLADKAVALTEPPVGGAKPLPTPLACDPGQPALLLVTHEDMHPESLRASIGPIAAALVVADRDLLWSDASHGFVQAAAQDAATRVASDFGCATSTTAWLNAEALITAAQQAGARQIVTPYAPVGPVADALGRLTPLLAGEGITLAQVRRAWDDRFWPHASKGFFPFREKIPAALAGIGALPLS
ncbi:FAD-binding domain-containing protein [Blastomonas sp.]|uniref:FAD-binding domain-containing protein n=1 Tax=Blastomonas sp. TaxID=1909299 RepID=UPI0035942B39